MPMDDPCGSCNHTRDVHWETYDAQEEGCAYVNSATLVRCTCVGFKPEIGVQARSCGICKRSFLPALCVKCHGTLCFPCCMKRSPLDHARL